jgi:Na+/H+ antiporter NhaA
LREKLAGVHATVAGVLVALFISGLSFGGEAAAGNAKLAIILASLFSGILGCCLIRWSLSASAERAET